MKHLRQTLLFILLGFLLSACRHTADRLLSIEQLIKQKPDSALSLLRQIQHPEKLSDSNRALYALLMTQVINQSPDEEHKSDSLISVAIDYYKGTTDSVHVALAYYNAGLVAMENEDSEASLHNFLKTIDWLGESDNDELQFMVRYKMSRLFNLRLIPDEELRLGKAALPYAERATLCISVHCCRISLTDLCRQINWIAPINTLCKRYNWLRKRTWSGPYPIFIHSMPIFAWQ